TSGATASKCSSARPNERRGKSMESATETTSVVREIAIAASPETVWQFLVDPERATLWMGQVATPDPRPGGVYRVDVIPGHTASGEFVEVDPPHRLVQNWGWAPGKGGPTSIHHRTRSCRRRIGQRRAR